MAADFVWPYYEGVDCDDIRANRPLAFLAQFSCAELKPFDVNGLLPETGMLSFFYEVESMPWGFDPSDRGAARVFWFENEILVPTDFPDDLKEEYHLGEMALDFSAEPMLPSYEEFEHLTRGKTGVDWDDYEEICEERELHVPNEENQHTVLGYAMLVQGERLTECEMVERRGLYTGNGDAMRALSEAECAVINADSRKWILLFQMGSLEEEGCELSFCDGGIYFYIRRDDLARRDFSHVWLVLQTG
ncbi:MAG: DUF1963 domain-containing protein [Clostridia bacterium]|nr:DUF1963 domain-containing protein [Clostridia bacterium]